MLKKITNFEEYKRFLEENKGFAVYISNPRKRCFIRFDENDYPLGVEDFYLIKSDEQIVNLTDLVKWRKNPERIVHVDLKQEINGED